MAKQYPALDDTHRAFIERQKMFFTATADRDGRVNLSPKGLGTFRVLDRNRVAWLDHGHLKMVGDADEAGMERFVMTVYVQSTAADTALQNLWRRALEVSPMARTLAESVQLELSLKIF